MHRVVAEFIGTFALVFAGCGAIVIDAETGGTIGHLGIAISFGLVIMVMIYATGHISGAHLNPAVTLTFALTRHLPFERAIGYWAGQLAGAISAALALRVLFGNTANLGATVPRGSAWQSFLLEIILTFMVMFVIMAVATDVRAVGQAAAIAIGGTVGLCAMFGGPISGASMNPARSSGSSTRVLDLERPVGLSGRTGDRRCPRRIGLSVRPRRHGVADATSAHNRSPGSTLVQRKILHEDSHSVRSPRQSGRHRSRLGSN